MPTLRFPSFITVSLMLVLALGAAPRARAEDPRPSPWSWEQPRPSDHAALGESPGLFGLRVLLPVYLGDIAMNGGRDYVGGDPTVGAGLRLDGAAYVFGGLTLGIALGFTYNPMTPQLTTDVRHAVTDVFTALLVGYRGTIGERVVVGGSLGAAYHVVRPSLEGGGVGALAELELGFKPHPDIVVGAGLSLEALSGVSHDWVLRVTPALLLELLL